MQKPITPRRAPSTSGWAIRKSAEALRWGTANGSRPIIASPNRRAMQITRLRSLKRSTASAA